MSTDPYVPGVGTDAAVIEHVVLDLDVRLAANRVSGTAVLSVRLTRQSRRIELDLHRLRVSKVGAAVARRPRPVWLATLAVLLVMSAGLLQLQASGVAQVGEAVQQMDQATQQNAALVEESAAAAGSLRQQAEQLNELVSVFRLSAR